MVLLFWLNKFNNEISVKQESEVNKYITDKLKNFN